MEEFDFHLPLVWGILGSFVGLFAFAFAAANPRSKRWFLIIGLVSVVVGTVLHIIDIRYYALHPFLAVGLGGGFVLGALFCYLRGHSASRSHL